MAGGVVVRNGAMCVQPGHLARKEPLRAIHAQPVISAWRQELLRASRAQPGRSAQWLARHQRTCARRVQPERTALCLGPANASRAQQGPSA